MWPAEINTCRVDHMWVGEAQGRSVAMPRTLTSLVLHTTVLVSAMTFATTSVADEKPTTGKTIVKVGDVD